MSAMISELGSSYYRWYLLSTNKIIGENSAAIQKLLNQQESFTSNELITILLTALGSSENLQNLFNRECFYCNGKLAKPQQSLTFPLKAELYLENKLPVITNKQSFCLPNNIIFENENFCIIYKPFGYPTLNLRGTQEFSIKEILEDHLKSKVHFPSRLDTETQGLLLVSKNSSYHNLAQQLFVEKKIKKIYLAKITTAVNWNELVLAAPIGYSLKAPWLRSVWGTYGKNALTQFKKLSNDRLLEVRPITGRTHQIRVHLKYLGYEIVGDRLYGKTLVNSNEILNLICQQLEFEDPITRQHHIFSVPQNMQPEWLII